MIIEEHSLKLEIIDQKEGGYAARFQREKGQRFGTRCFSDYRDMLRWLNKFLIQHTAAVAKKETAPEVQK